MIREVNRVLRNPSTNAIVLYGQRRIGKTSILLQLKNSLQEAGDYTPVYFDLAKKASLRLSEILYEIGQEVAFVTTLVPGKKTDYDSEGIFFRRELIPKATKKTNKALVFLFDEFDVLDRQAKRKSRVRFALSGPNLPVKTIPISRQYPRLRAKASQN